MGLVLRGSGLGAMPERRRKNCLGAEGGGGKEGFQCRASHSKPGDTQL